MLRTLIFIFLISPAAMAVESPELLPTTSPKRAYPGGADEEDLRVLPSLPEAAQRADARRIQKDVFKALYNQELKDESSAPMEE